MATNDDEEYNRKIRMRDMGGFSTREENNRNETILIDEHRSYSFY